MGGGRGELSGQGVRRRRVKCPSGRGAGVCVLGAAGGRCRAAVSASLGVKGAAPRRAGAGAASGAGGGPFLRSPQPLEWGKGRGAPRLTSPFHETVTSGPGCNSDGEPLGETLNGFLGGQT